MRVIEDAWRGSEKVGPCVLTVGKFDGIHRGQRAILDRVTQRARSLGVLAAVVTFEPHPRVVLQSGDSLQLITTVRQKRELIAAAGIDILLEVGFDRAFARTSAREFCTEFLARRLGAREIHVGRSFQFGRDRTGNLDSLEALGRELGIEVAGVAEVMEDDGPVSSTRIRAALREGRVGLAARMLGRAYSITGTVARGAGRGRRIGWPTVNLAPDNDLIPADGVYATWVEIGRPGRAYESVTNVGMRPTFDDDCGRIVESHLLEFEGPTGSEPTELVFMERLRGERKFPSVEELTTQIARDVESAREYFERQRC